MACLTFHTVLHTLIPSLVLQVAEGLASVTLLFARNFSVNVCKLCLG